MKVEIKKLKEGCKKNLGMYGGIIVRCGDLYWDEVKDIKEVQYCPECKTKLSTIQSCLKDELRFLEDIREQENLTCKVCKTRNDKIFNKLEELKQSIKEEK